MGWTLSRYFFLRYAAMTGWFFAGIFALVFLVDFTELSRRLGDAPAFSIGVTASISALRVPLIMQQTAPFIGLFSAMAMLVNVNRKFELVVARAAGISAWAFLLPICLGALLFGILNVAVVNPLAAEGLARSENIEADLRSDASSRSATKSAPWLRQHTDEGDTIIGAQALKNNGLTLVSPVFLSLDAGGNIRVRRDADQADLRDGYWELRNVQRYEAGVRLTALASEQVATNLKPAYVRDSLAQPEGVSVFALPAQISDAAAYGLRTAPYEMQLHSLIAMPFLLIAMTLIAATVSMRFARMGQSATLILGGVAAGFLLYVVSVLVRAFGNAGFVPPAVAAWVPVVFASAFGVTFLLYKEDG